MATTVGMLRWLAGANFNNDILRALFPRKARSGYCTSAGCRVDTNRGEALLAWAADQSRVLTHDVQTVTPYAYRRVMKGDPMSGVFEVSRHVSVRSGVECIILRSECSNPGEWEGQVRDLPMR